MIKFLFWYLLIVGSIDIIYIALMLRYNANRGGK